MLTKPSYLELVTKYNKAAAKAVAEGRQVYLHKGKSDVFRVFMKHGALSTLRLSTAFQRTWY